MQHENGLNAMALVCSMMLANEQTSPGHAPPRSNKISSYVKEVHELSSDSDSDSSASTHSAGTVATPHCTYVHSTIVYDGKIEPMLRHQESFQFPSQSQQQHHQQPMQRQDVIPMYYKQSGVPAPVTLQGMVAEKERRDVSPPPPSNANVVTGRDIERYMKHDRQTKTWQCTKCLKDFKTKYVCKRHIEAHLVQKPYSCNVCNRKFQRLDQLQRHHRKILRCKAVSVASDAAAFVRTAKTQNPEPRCPVVHAPIAITKGHLGATPSRSHAPIAVT